MPGGRGGSAQDGQMRTREEGGQKLARFCGRLLWMAPNLYPSPQTNLYPNPQTNPGRNPYSNLYPNPQTNIYDIVIP